MRRNWLIGLFLFMPLPAQADIACFKVQSVESGEVVIDQGTNCDKPYSPPSTFKIFLSLVGFDEGLLYDEHTPVFPYIADVRRKDRDLWKQDTDPRMWMQYSNVWYSQRLVELMGHDKVADYVDHACYGNKVFDSQWPWLDSTLQITPNQQLAFLSAVASNRSGFTENSVSKTKALMRYDFPVQSWQLFGKTGTMTVQHNKQFGWYVGWLEKGPQSYSFVYLLDDIDNADEPAGPTARAQVIPELIKLAARL